MVLLVLGNTAMAMGALNSGLGVLTIKISGFQKIEPREALIRVESCYLYTSHLWF